MLFCFAGAPPVKRPHTHGTVHGQTVRPDSCVCATQYLQGPFRHLFKVDQYSKSIFSSSEALKVIIRRITEGGNAGVERGVDLVESLLKVSLAVLSIHHGLPPTPPPHPGSCCVS